MNAITGFCQLRPRPRKTRAIRFILERPIVRRTFNNELRCPDRRVIIGTEPAPCEQCLQIGPRLGLYEELVESRVRAIRVMGGKAQFSGTDQLQFPRAQTMIGQRNAANLHIIFRRHRHFHVTIRCPRLRRRNSARSALKIAV